MVFGFLKPRKKRTTRYKRKRIRPQVGDPQWYVWVKCLYCKHEFWGERFQKGATVSGFSNRNPRKTGRCPECKGYNYFK